MQVVNSDGALPTNGLRPKAVNAATIPHLFGETAQDPEEDIVGARRNYQIPKVGRFQKRHIMPKSFLQKTQDSRTERFTKRCNLLPSSLPLMAEARSCERMGA